MPREPQPSTICVWPRWPSTFSSGSDTCGTEPGNGTPPSARPNGDEGSDSAGPRQQRRLLVEASWVGTIPQSSQPEEGDDMGPPLRVALDVLKPSTGTL